MKFSKFLTWLTSIERHLEAQSEFLIKVPAKQTWEGLCHQLPFLLHWYIYDQVKLNDTNLILWIRIILLWLSLIKMGVSVERNTVLMETNNPPRCAIRCESCLLSLSYFSPLCRLYLAFLHILLIINVSNFSPTFLTWHHWKVQLLFSWSVVNGSWTAWCNFKGFVTKTVWSGTQNVHQTTCVSQALPQEITVAVRLPLPTSLKMLQMYRSLLDWLLSGYRNRAYNLFQSFVFLFLCISLSLKCPTWMSLHSNQSGCCSSSSSLKSMFLLIF